MKQIEELNENLPLSDWIETIHQSMKAKGFHESSGSIRADFLAKMALIHTEIMELEDGMQYVYFVYPGKPDTWPRIEDAHNEVADILIRLFDILGFINYKSTKFFIENNILKLYSFSCSIFSSLSDEISSLHNNCAKISQHAKRCFDDKDISSSTNLSLRSKQDQPDLELLLVDFIYGVFKFSYMIGLTPFLLSEQIKSKMIENMARPHKYGTPSAEVKQNGWWS